jgi:hypothetical protein
MPEVVVVVVLELHAATITPMMSKDPDAAAAFQIPPGLFAIFLFINGFLQDRLPATEEPRQVNAAVWDEV